MSAQVKEIRIVGGGLAGLSLGVALRARDIPTRIHEAGSYPRHKVCGEFISGLAEETIDTLGIRSTLADAQLHDRVAWLRDGAVFRRDTLPRPAYGISRYRLDQRLAESFVQSGGMLEIGSRMRDTEKRLVWTAGRQRSRSDWIGVKLHCRSLRLRADLEVHLGEGAYAGASAVEEGRVNVCALVKRPRSMIASRREEAFFEILSAVGLQDLAERVRRSDPDFSSRSSVAGLGFGRAEWKPGCIRIGDAYALAPPFTGDGMAMAFEGAAAAVEPLVRYARGETDWEEAELSTRRRLESAFRRRLAVAQGIHSFLYERKGQALFRAGSKARVLPFKPLFNLLH